MKKVAIEEKVYKEKGRDKNDKGREIDQQIRTKRVERGKVDKEKRRQRKRGKGREMKKAEIRNNRDRGRDNNEKGRERKR
jgi:hypothetical protein